jgi:hypothetical protein
MSPPPPPAPPRSRAAGGRDPLLLGGAALLLAVIATLVGARGWPRPDRTSSGWQVAEVPKTLLVLLAVAAVVCVAVAAALTRPWQLPWPVAVVWWLLAFVAVFAHGWNDLYFAALADPGGGAIIPVFDGFFTFIPALVVALAAIPAGRQAQLRAGLGTAVVGVPLLALGWAIYAAPGGYLSAALGSLWPTAFFGVAPVAVALALTVPLNPRSTPTG